MTSYKPYEIGFESIKSATNAGNNSNFQSERSFVDDSKIVIEPQMQIISSYDIKKQKYSDNNFDNYARFPVSEGSSNEIQNSNVFVNTLSLNNEPLKIQNSNDFVNITSSMANREYDIDEKKNDIMPDLEAASKNHVNTIDSDEDIEQETADIIGGIPKIELEENINNTTEKHKKPGIVIQIIKEEGNLKMKRVSNGKSAAGRKKRKHDESDEDLLEVDVEAMTCNKCGENFHSEAQWDSHVIVCGTSNDPGSMFLCEICDGVEDTLEELLLHLKETHEEIEVPEDYEELLYKQRQAIFKIKKTVNELIALKKYKAVTQLLNSSKSNLESFRMDLFGSGEVNVFKKFLSITYNEMETLLYERINSTRPKSTRKKKKTFDDGIYIQEIDDSDAEKRPRGKSKRKGTAKKSSKKLKKNVRQSNIEFSSEDDICLKDSMIKEKDAKVMEDGEIVGRLEPPESNELCLQFYAVPYSENGKPLTFFELAAVRQAIEDIWGGTKVELDHLSHVLIKRFEKEIDEVLPDDAVFCGYASKGNDTIFKESKRLGDLFDEACLLNDGTRSHKTSKLKNSNCTINSNDDNDEDDNNEKINEGNEKNNENSDYNDDYDDGFDKATAYLTERPEGSYRAKRKTSSDESCDICYTKFVMKNRLVEHVKNKHELEWKMRYSCKICELKFVPRKRLLKHEKTHNTTLVECEICCDRFLSAEKKAEHFKDVHSSSDIFDCGLCYMNFEDINLLTEHFDKLHSLDYLTQSTNVLPIEFVRKKDTKKIKYNKDSSDAPECKICKRKFTSAGRLQQHNTVMHIGVPFRRKKKS